VFVPYLAGERSPFWRDDLRGLFIGLNLGHTWAHLLRAVIEGVGLSARLLLERFLRLGLPSPTVALSGGVAKHPIWQRILSDTCQRTLALYGSNSAASNVVYALCAQQLQPGLSLADAINRLFGKPQLIPPDPATKAIYERAYTRYCHYLQAMLTETTLEQ
ncbi:MAG: FGGY-family carbohydrate kinase, partial [Anaerolineae bacterium]|nr:FGGY-family carbohydrate kinase [Thermoflexales bacterium]MDW8408651.1 FGGY-family carbohydrate kinase [Anaerolineae bacterium]